MKDLRAAEFNENGNVVIKQKFIRKYMRVAKLIGEDDNPCFSRQIGAVIVDPVTNAIRGTGYNGPPPGTPHTDTYEYLSEFFWPQLTPSDKRIIANKHLGMRLRESVGDTELREKFAQKFHDCKICPRRLVNAKSGERLDLCSCGHAERHAITNAACSVHGFIMFCWCTVPCLQCSDAIIQAGISAVYCLDEELYHKQSEWLLRRGGVDVIKRNKSEFIDPPQLVPCSLTTAPPAAEKPEEPEIMKRTCGCHDNLLIPEEHNEPNKRESTKTGPSRDGNSR